MKELMVINIDSDINDDDEDDNDDDDDDKYDKGMWLFFFSVTTVQTPRNEKWSYSIQCHQRILQMGSLPWTQPW